MIMTGFRACARLFRGSQELEVSNGSTLKGRTGRRCGMTERERSD